MSDRRLAERMQPLLKRWRLGLSLLLGGAAAAALGAWAFAPSTIVQGAKRDGTQKIALGRMVYEQSCASCHGVDLEGQPNWRIRKPDGRLPAPPHDETGHTWHHPDQQLFEITKSGVAALVPGYETDMPPFADALSDEEIWAVLAYIKSTWSPEVRLRQDRRNEGAEQ